MLLIELTTLTTSSRLKNLGVKISDDDYIQIKSFIDIGKITHLTENPDDKSITNIYLTNGVVLYTDIKLLELIDYLQNAHREMSTNV
ncbi:MAG: hypothetical protein HRT87_07905 [Legionellales bacterium]|nr:hypothetical protein [Legionellales bacterium]